MSENLPSVWKPAKFEGNDLLPATYTGEASLKPAKKLLGRDNISEKDIIVPQLKLLQGMSPEVMNAPPGSGISAGMFFHTGVKQAILAPVRVVGIYHTKSKALFIDPKKPEYSGLEQCLSRDGVTGTVYGDCEQCGKCTEWRKNPMGGNRLPPLGAESHNLIVLTKWGPAMLRMSRTSYQNAREFVSAWNDTPDKQLWHHPIVLTAEKKTSQMPSGQTQTWYVVKPQWQYECEFPEDVQSSAETLYHRFHDAFVAGKLDSDGEEGVQRPTPASGAKPQQDFGEIPF